MPPTSDTCTICKGDGFTVERFFVCCGNTDQNGECRGDCHMEQELDEPCPRCGGDGKEPKQRHPHSE